MSTHELTTLYQLCRLGIPGPVLASTLFENLRATIACDAITLLWQPPMSPAAKWFHESESELKCGVVDKPAFLPLLAAMPSSQVLALLEADLSLRQRLLEVLSSVSHVIEQSAANLVLHLLHGGQRVGLMLLHRRGPGAFSTAEKAALVRWAPVLSSGLHRDMRHGQFVTSETAAGIVLVDRQMKIQSACCRGRKLLQLCEAEDEGARIGYGGASLRRLLHHNFGANRASSASFVLRNGWGSFQFRLHSLVDASITSDTLTAIALHRQDPLPLSVLRRANDLALTQKQTEICLLLIEGLSYGEMATKLHISSTTVVDHMRKLYDKLGVSSRSELVARLLLGEQSCDRLALA